jgi:hypothetical protein
MKDEAIRKMFLEGPSLIVACERDTYRVSVRDDVVEPSGYVETFAEALEAKHVVLSGRGVRTVAEEIAVRWPRKKTRPDCKEKKMSDTELVGRAVRLLS